jgi:hypothetical protein
MVGFFLCIAKIGSASLAMIEFSSKWRKSQFRQFLRCVSAQIANPQIFITNQQIANQQIFKKYCTPMSQTVLTVVFLK